MVAQSIFSHTARDLVAIAFRNFHAALAESGMALVTFVEGADYDGEEGWVYPGIVTFREETIHGFARAAGLLSARLPWYHPRQTWYMLTKDPARLPNKAALKHLTGAVFDPEFEASYKKVKVDRPKNRYPRWKKWVAACLPAGVRDRLIARSQRKQG